MPAPPVITEVVTNDDASFFTDYYYNSLQRTDGLPDDCGDLQTAPDYDLVFPAPVPSPGDVLAPLVNKILDLVATDGTPYQVEVPIGPLRVSPENELLLDIADTVHRIDENLDLAPLAQSAEEIAGQIEELAGNISDIEDSLSVDISGDSTYAVCDGDDIVAAYSGEGLSGISDQLTSILQVLNGGGMEYCQLLSPGSPVGASIATRSMPSSDIANFSDFILDSETKYVCVSTSNPARRFANGNSNVPEAQRSQGKCAIVGIGIVVSGSPHISRVENQYFRSGVYAYNQVDGQSSLIRVSLDAGVSAVIQEFG